MFKKSSKLLIRVSKRAVLIPHTWPLPPGQGSTNYFRRAQMPDHHHFSTVLSKHEMCYVNFWSTRSCCYFSNSEAGPTVWQQFLTLLNCRHGYMSLSSAPPSSKYVPKRWAESHSQSMVKAQELVWKNWFLTRFHFAQFLYSKHSAFRIFPLDVK